MHRTTSSFAYTLAGWLQTIELGDIEGATLIASRVDTDGEFLRMKAELDACVAQHVDGMTGIELVHRLRQCVACVTASLEPNVASQMPDAM